MRLTVIGAGYVGSVAAARVLAGRMRGRLVVNARNARPADRVVAAGLRTAGVGW